MVRCMTGPAPVASPWRPPGATLVALVAGALLATGCEPVEGSAVDGKAAIDASIVDATPDAPVRVADSERDFAGTQGAGGWQYLYQEMPSEVRRELVYSDGAWVVDDERFWTQLWVTGGHPNVGGRVADGPVAIHLPVRRWLSDAEGAATIAYRASREHPGPCGDGVVTRVIVDDVLRWEQPLPGDGTGPTVVEGELMVTLGTGSTVELVIDPVAGDGCDSTAFKAVITVTAPD
jgi:hypothetical protein